MAQLAPARVRTATSVVIALAIALLFPACNRGAPGDGAPGWNSALLDRVTKLSWKDTRADENLRTLDDALEGLKPRSWERERALYLEKVAEGFLSDEIARLEAELAKVDDDVAHYVESRALLKEYLTLTEANGSHPNLDVDYATDTIAVVWCERIKAAIGTKELCFVSDGYPEGHVKPHLRFFFESVKANQTTPPVRDDALVEKVRAKLATVPLRARYGAMFVDVVRTERYDESGSFSSENLVFPPISLSRIFKNRPILAPQRGWIFDSAKRRKDGSFYELEGTYTTRAGMIVRAELEHAEGRLAEEAWVVPLDTEEMRPGAIRTAARAVSDDYEARLVDAWTAFLADVVVRRPRDVEECLMILEELTRSDYPFVSLLGTVAEEAQRLEPSGVPTGLIATLNRSMVQPRHGPLRRSGPSTAAPPGLLPERFRSLVSFTMRASPPADHVAYLDILKNLQKVVSTRRRETPGLELRALDAELADARAKTEALLATYDPFAVATLKALLLPALTAEVPITVPRAVPK